MGLARFVDAIDAREAESAEGRSQARCMAGAPPPLEEVVSAQGLDLNAMFG
jgi:hypothetical protein